jgi:hypothetical protein
MSEDEDGRLLHGKPVDMCALAALRHVESTTDERVAEVIRSQVRPQWADIGALAKKILVFHALNKTDDDLGPALFGAEDPVLGTHVSSKVREAFRTALALLCEKHMQGQITDAEFVHAARQAYVRQLSPDTG